MKRLILLVLIMVVCCSCVFGCTTVTGNEGNSTSESESLTESENESVSEKESVLDSENLTESEQTSESEKESAPTIFPEEVTDVKTVERLIGIDLTYEYIPTLLTTSVRMIDMWDGNGKKNIDTFLVEYLQTTQNYYFIYLRKNLINDYAKYMEEYEKKKQEEYAKDYYNVYQFEKFDNQNVIDGKYLFAHIQANGSLNDIKVFKCDNLDTISFTYDDYQLVLCERVKPAIVKQNLSTKRRLNSPFTIYKRQTLIYDEMANQLEENDLDWDNIVSRKAGVSFDYVGQMIETYGVEYEKIKYCYYHILGRETLGGQSSPKVEVVNDENQKYVILPRYVANGYDDNGLRVWVDFLDEEYDFNKLFFVDVFGKYRSEFKNAFVKICENSDETKIKIYGFYDYDKVIEIIKN